MLHSTRCVARWAAPVLLSALCWSSLAKATIVERVVAIVGERAIFMSDMRQRARPFLLQIQQRVPSDVQRAAAESEMFKQLLARMVEERLEQEAADKAHLAVSTDEIDAGIKNVATQQNITHQQLLEEAAKSGLTPQEYRDEIRRQILEGKLLQLRVRGRIRLTEEDVRVVYDKLVTAERKRQTYRASWIVLHVPPTSSPEAKRDRELLAESLYHTAHAGIDRQGHAVDFANLARSFSDDTPTRASGGDLGSHKVGELAQVLDDAALKLEAGEVAAPIPYKDGIVVLKVTEREASRVPPFATARDEVTQRAYSEQMDRARKEWLQQLRARTYVDVRM